MSKRPDPIADVEIACDWRRDETADVDICRATVNAYADVAVPRIEFRTGVGHRERAQGKAADALRRLLRGGVLRSLGLGPDDLRWLADVATREIQAEGLTPWRRGGLAAGAALPAALRHLADQIEQAREPE